MLFCFLLLINSTKLFFNQITESVDNVPFLVLSSFPMFEEKSMAKILELVREKSEMDMIVRSKDGGQIELLQIQIEITVENSGEDHEKEKIFIPSGTKVLFLRVLHGFTEVTVVIDGKEVHGFIPNALIFRLGFRLNWGSV